MAQLNTTNICHTTHGLKLPLDVDAAPIHPEDLHVLPLSTHRANRRHTITTPNPPLSTPPHPPKQSTPPPHNPSLLTVHPQRPTMCSHRPSPTVLMSIVRKTSITVTHADMASPVPLVWDVRYTVKSPGTQTPEWHPTAWRRTPLQRLKFLQSGKQETDAKGNAAKALSREVDDWLYLIRETDNVGRAAKLYFTDKGGFRGFRLQAAKRGEQWEATVWPGHEDLGWPDGKVARARKLETCLKALQVMIRDKWSAGTGSRGEVAAMNKLMGAYG
ncbi:hypothetical protein PMIN05_005503 [Paraphaeosphaeria minitans]